MNWLRKIFKKRNYIPVRLTIKAIIRWEQMNKKPFSELNYNSEEEVLSLFYSCSLSDDIQVTFNDFKENLKPEEAKRMGKDFERQTSLMAQFQIEIKKQNKESKEAGPFFIKDIAATLVMNGLDARFVLNDMELCDIPVFLKAYDQRVKEELSVQRLWAFMQLSPHLKKGTTPKDIHPFAWELEKDTLSEEELKQGREESIIFLKNQIKK